MSHILKIPINHKKMSLIRNNLIYEPLTPTLSEYLSIKYPPIKLAGTPTKNPRSVDPKLTINVS